MQQKVDINQHVSKGGDFKIAVILSDRVDLANSHGYIQRHYSPQVSTAPSRRTDSVHSAAITQHNSTPFTSVSQLLSCRLRKDSAHRTIVSGLT